MTHATQINANAFRRRSPQRGFTLIELLIVVAIISILSAIGFPQYQRFVAKSRLAAAYTEISAGKIGVESLVADGQDASAPQEIGLMDGTPSCNSIDVSVTGATGEASIACSLPPHSVYGSATLQLTRRASDAYWQCEATLAQSDNLILPAECR